MCNRIKTVSILAAAVMGVSASAYAAPKNVILMIGDGMGFNHVQTGAVYYGERPIYESFSTKVAMQTYSASGNNPYNSSGMAGDFAWQTLNPTDSASAATAMYTGVKIHDGVINVDPTNTTLQTYYEKAAFAGKAVGAVSSVEISHATPGAVYGHNSSRNNYAAISSEGILGSNPLDSQPNSGSNSSAGNNNLYDAMNYNGNLKVLMGAGHGDYTSNGAYSTSQTDRYVGGDLVWSDITDGTAPNGWSYVETKGDFESIAAGSNVPGKLLGIAQVNTTLQHDRSGKPADANNPSGMAFNDNVPTLATMSRAALQVLSQQPAGFSVMIEGGAIDWAGHANNTGRLIEEQRDFDLAVKAVYDFIDAGTNGVDWSNTLLIVTADHETGGLWGDGSYIDADGNGRFGAGDTFIGYQQVSGTEGVLPEVQWTSGDHTNALVPLYAMGEGDEMFLGMVVGNEANLSAMYGADVTAGFSGDYIDNTSIHSVMMSSVPEPASLSLLAGAGLLLGRRRQRPSLEARPF